MLGLKNINDSVITLLEGVSESMDKYATREGMPERENSPTSIKRRLTVAREELMKIIHSIDKGEYC